MFNTHNLPCMCLHTLAQTENKGMGLANLQKHRNKKRFPQFITLKSFTADDGRVKNYPLTKSHDLNAEQQIKLQSSPIN